ncbi:MAG: ribose 5-phosphate isomerase B [Clostridia bacterium]|nr:ribose 5-phosphate isomerase B [Clostridia bacterium]
MNDKGKICAIASDGAGFKLKCVVSDYLKGLGYEIIDCGTDSEASCDYPDFAVKCCLEITEGRAGFGILCCGTGVGMSMAANKVKGIRAACCSDTFSARATRSHNDANVLCIGERVVGPGLAKELIDAFISTSFEGGRHQRRIDKVMEIENS